eukprot:g28556.t1
MSAYNYPLGLHLFTPSLRSRPQLPALPKRSFWEVPSFHVAPARNPRAALPSLSPQRAESVESFRPPAVEVKRPSASESPRRRRLPYPRARGDGAMADGKGGGEDSCSCRVVLM